AQRHHGALGAGRLRPGHGLQRLGVELHHPRRAEGAHRLHAPGGEGAVPVRLRLPRQAGRPAQGLVGQGVQGVTAAAVSTAAGRSKSAPPRWSAAGLIGPATVLVVLILLLPLVLLFRYSLNRFVPGQFMVDALTAENYVALITDPYYQSVLTTTLTIASLC